MRELELWKFILGRLTEHQPVMFIVVVDYKKGSPGKTGFKIAFTRDKKFVGTIGGGVMEHSLVEQYSNRMENEKTILDLRVLVHSQSTSSGEPSGLQCAGSQSMCAISLKESDISTIRSIYNALNEHLSARILLTENGIEYIERKNSTYSIFHQQDSLHWKFEENIGPEYTIYVIGGGHVGHALSRILATLDFYVVLYDDRKDLPLFTENKFAHKKIAAPFSEIASHIIDPKKSFATIVTSNSNSDTAAIKQILPLHLPYVGIMGADAKIARIKKALNEAELKEYQKQNIHAPIGLPIESRSVEEIAISIAAEIIIAKNRE